MLAEIALGVVALLTGWALGRWEVGLRANRAYMLGWQDAAEHFPEEQAAGYDLGYRDALRIEKARSNGVPRY